MPKKKGRARTRGAERAYDPNEKRRERLEAKRAAREAAAAAQARAARRARLTRWVSVAAIMTLAVWFFFLRNVQPTEIDGHAITEFSVLGSGDHTSDPVNYETFPPVAGAHANEPGPCGVLPQQIPNETQVHTLEHGAVGVQYKPDLDPKDIKTIEKIVKSYDSHVFSAPYTEMESQIAVTSWGRAMLLDSVDEDAIREYIDTFKEKGPEDLPCPNEVDEPFGASPSPSALPENITIPVTPSPAPQGGGGDDGGGNGGQGGGGSGNGGNSGQGGGGSGGGGDNSGEGGG